MAVTSANDSSSSSSKRRLNYYSISGDSSSVSSEMLDACVYVSRLFISTHLLTLPMPSCRWCVV